MTEIQTPQKKTAPVFVRLYDYEGEGDTDAKCEVKFGETEVLFYGDPKMIVDCASGLCHVFDISINTDALTEADFIGMIPLDKNGSMPRAVVKTSRVMAKGIGFMTQVYLCVGNRSMNFGTRDSDAGAEVAFGLSQLFNLPQKDKLGREFAGQIIME